MCSHDSQELTLLCCSIWSIRENMSLPEDMRFLGEVGRGSFVAIVFWKDGDEVFRAVPNALFNYRSEWGVMMQRDVGEGINACPSNFER